MKKYEKIDKLIAAFSFKSLQETEIILKSFKRNGITSSDFLEYIKTRKGQFQNLRNEANKEWGIKALKCKHCKKAMELRSINTSKCNSLPLDQAPNEQIKKEWEQTKSVWICHKCKEEIFNKNSVKKEKESRGLL